MYVPSGNRIRYDSTGRCPKVKKKMAWHGMAGRVPLEYPRAEAATILRSLRPRETEVHISSVMAMQVEPKWQLSFDPERASKHIQVWKKSFGSTSSFPRGGDAMEEKCTNE
jgi:hypothetical protein